MTAQEMDQQAKDGFASVNNLILPHTGPTKDKMMVVLDFSLDTTTNIGCHPKKRTPASIPSGQVALCFLI
jgi:hypothetical protein